MKVIVHIGTEKTGTTSIQRYLYLNRKKLRTAGYHFIQSAGETNNRALPAYCVSEDKFDDFFRAEGITTLEEKEQFKQRFLKDFEAELHGLPENIHTVLISSEHFHSRIRTEEEMDNVHALLSSYFEDIKIVCYLREQVTTCTSYYSTHLKSGGTESFQRFLQRCKPTNSYYNYSEMLGNWERCFGKSALDVALFSKTRFLNQNLLDDFTAKINPDLVGKLNQNVEAENESLQPAGQVLARIMNLVFPVKSEIPEVAVIREKAKKVIAKSMTGKGQQPDWEAWQSTSSLFVESNEEVRKRFFPDVEQLFSDPVAPAAVSDIIDDGFNELLFTIVNLIKKNKTTAFMPDVNARLWSTVSTCVTDVDGVEGVDLHDGRPPVVLEDRDAHLLKLAAITIEEINPQTALKLMTLASKAKPRLPVVREKLEEYRQRGLDKENMKPKAKFFLTYHGGEKPLSKKEYKDLNARSAKWLQSLDIPPGATLVPVRNTRTINVEGVEANRSQPAITGYTVFRATGMKEAVKLAGQCPHLEIGGTIEVSEVTALWPQ